MLVSAFRAVVLFIVSIAFGVAGSVCLFIGALLFVEAVTNNAGLETWANVGSAYALLILGTLFIIVSLLAFIGNVVSDHNLAQDESRSSGSD